MTEDILPSSSYDQIEANSTMGTKVEQISKDSFIKPPQYPIKTQTIGICFNCPIEDCTMLFKTEEEVQKHKLDHKNLFTCTYERCNKCFREIINLKKHFKSHFTKQKIHCCPYPGCNKKFTESYNLTIHYRHHTGDKPYSCEICGKRFFDRTNYKYHINVKHIKVDVKDTICQHKGCNRKSKTIKQKLMHHNILEPECKGEKNQLLNILLCFQKTAKEFLEKKEENKEVKGENEKPEENDEFKEEIENIKKQENILVGLIVDKDQYKGIIGNY